MIDGNEAAASAAFRLNELCSIYPITPSSTMAELADEWSAAGKVNIYGQRPTVIEMQSEAGAAGALHGALQGGALSTTFTASQGLLLMIPNMYKIAGELTSTVFHVAARSLATQGLSIYGDHQDVMAVRQTGFALLSSASVQEAHDMAVIAQLATLTSRVPFLHFFDGFRTSHEVNSCELVSDDQLSSLIPFELVLEHRRRALSPENPFIRGTAQNPDVHFQACEVSNSFYDKTPGIVCDAMEKFAEVVGRGYKIAEYHGDPEADRVVLVMGSGAQTVKAGIDYLLAKGEKVGMVQLRLYRPFPTEAVLAAIPASATKIAVLDRTKEPGSAGEPFYLDVSSAFGQAFATGKRERLPIIIGGRYGLSSKEFTPAMVVGVFDELLLDFPRPRFTVGINDDVTHLSLPYDEHLDTEDPSTLRAVFFGMGSDGTVGANKNTIKIIGSIDDTYAQGYFVYDSKKSGSRTVSHLRFGPKPIQAPYLVNKAGFIGCHHWSILEKVDILKYARQGTVLLVNSPYPEEEVFGRLPRQMQAKIIELGIELWSIDANMVARKTGMGNRTNTILQTCFFAISNVMPRDEAIAEVKKAIKKTYMRKGGDVVAKNELAVDSSIADLHRIDVPAEPVSNTQMISPVPADSPEFVRTVTASMLAETGDTLPVSAIPVDGTFPSGTTKYEKRNVSDIIAVWDKDACIQCGNCAFVCPHAVLRAKYYKEAALEGAPASFQSAPLNAAGFPGSRYTLQVFAEDCTGCGLCTEACPVRVAGEGGSRKAINQQLVLDRGDEKENVRFFETIKVNRRSRIDFSTVRGTQYMEPLFEFSGACAGCGETPYVKLLSQLFGGRATVANATGCSSIYGGNLPTTPWASNKYGRGPAWSNSLFDDNAEFGLGLRLAADVATETARARLESLRPQLGDAVVDPILNAKQRYESELSQQRARVDALKKQLDGMDSPLAADLRSVCDHLLRRSVWIVGGDGWAYDIGSGGVDHVLASGRNVNILVLDTEVYSNTGGQSSKSTPMGAVARFASAGKVTTKKDLALQAISYGNVYVARVAMGADKTQTLNAFREAEAYDGPSLILAYSHCIAHGIDMRKGLTQQYAAVASGHWPLVRYNPILRAAGKNPFLLDSPRPRISLRQYHDKELRFRSLQTTDPVAAERFLELGQAEVLRRWQEYEEMSSRGADRYTEIHSDKPVE
jgi:pyruvate-ferredoxin/flavodoxin oxidoreductase